MKDKISKKEKLQTLGLMYIIPLICTLTFPILKNLEINGEPAGFLWMSLLGFVVGIAVEGALFILGVTVAVLFNKA